MYNSITGALLIFLAFYSYIFCGLWCLYCTMHQVKWNLWRVFVILRRIWWFSPNPSTVFGTTRLFTLNFWSYIVRPNNISKQKSVIIIFQLKLSILMTSDRNYNPQCCIFLPCHPSNPNAAFPHWFSTSSFSKLWVPCLFLSVKNLFLLKFVAL